MKKIAAMITTVAVTTAIAVPAFAGGITAEQAKEIAISENCYKIMLMTGSKKESTLNFYRKAGYRSDDKTGFNQKL